MAKVWLLLVCCVLVMPARAVAQEASHADSAEIERVVQAVCKKEVVLLGEDLHHAGAATLAVKVLLVKRLVRECGFRGVVFESQFYDMLDFEHAAAAGTASRQQLADAIGAIWSRYPAFAPLTAWLYDETKAGRLRVGGMDPQAAGIGAHFSAEQLPARLVSVLYGERRGACESAIQRQNNWNYDDAHPYDAAALEQLRGCLRDIDGRLAATGQHAPPDLRAMAASYAAYLAFMAQDGSADVRDRAMYRNFRWLRAQWPRGTRIVVWTASVHAAKSPDGAFRPFGSYLHADFGARAAAIGFSALAGSYGNVGGHGAPHRLAPAVEGSLEARAFAPPGASSWRFLDQAQLRALGRRASRVLDYGKPATRDWAQVLDGVVVLREETAARATP